MSAVPPDVESFNAQVWSLVRQVPSGRVTTYGRVAERLGPPPGVDPETFRVYGARWVGAAMAASPGDVPWQRVVNAQGEISIRQGGLHLRQRSLLEAEGVEFNARGQIDLGRFGWEPGVPQQGSLW